MLMIDAMLYDIFAMLSLPLFIVTSPLLSAIAAIDTIYFRRIPYAFIDYRHCYAIDDIFAIDADAARYYCHIFSILLLPPRCHFRSFSLPIFAAIAASATRLLPLRYYACRRFDTYAIREPLIAATCQRQMPCQLIIITPRYCLRRHYTYIAADTPPLRLLIRRH